MAGDSPPITGDELGLYAHEMERVKLRVTEALALLDAPHGDERHIVYAALQTRLALEQVTLAGLVSNRAALEAAGRSLSKHTDLGPTQLLIRGVNPDYWPKGVEPAHGETGTEWRDVADGLSEDDARKAWGRLSAFLHAPNPYRPDDLPAVELVSETLRKLTLQLNEHLVRLSGGWGMVCCQVWAHPVRAYYFERVS